MVEWKRSGPQPGTDYSDILYEAADGIAKITINRPEVRNAFRPTTLSELSNAFNSARDDPGIGVIILTGAGEAAVVPLAALEEETVRWARDAFKEKRTPDFAQFPRRP